MVRMEPNENKGPEDPTPASPSEPTPPFTPPLSALPPPAGPSGTEERTWAMAAHLTALSALLGVPFGHALGPLIIWLIKKDTMPFVADQGKEALNFQLTQTIVLLGCAALIFLTCGIGAIIGVPLAIADSIFLLVMAVIGGLNANNGVSYRYPVCWRMIK